MKSSKSDKKISVRLTPEANNLLQEAKTKGYTVSNYINGLILGTVALDLAQYRCLIPNLCHLESLLTEERDTELRNEMKKEINGLWRFLKSFQEDI